ncbi:uncharacterized protein LOC108674487 [Hyalella azteca]|uniref:Uncharacterized protein LOC108674487 n=1 Tax=Hyalella azteca TaxID=294128 RepID=A0A8B7NYH8_HYAAZ|nr:uncharacterized protein LOC108674487 [Hyalella azteca]
MDVVIVTDEVNHCVVQSLCRHHPRVGVLSYPDFLRDPAGRMAAVKQLQLTWNSFPVTETEVNNSYSSKTDVNNPSSHSAVLESVNGSDRMKDLNNQTSSEPPTNGTNGSSEPLAKAKTDESSDDGSSEPLAEAKTDKSSDDGSSEPLAEAKTDKSADDGSCEPLAEAKTDKSADDAGNSSIATSGMPSIACISTTNPSMECDNINEPVAHCVPGCVSPVNELSQQEDSSVTRFVDDKKRTQATSCATDDSRAGAAYDSFNGPSKEIALEDDIVMEDNEQPGNCEKLDCDSRIECNSEKMSQPERNVLWLIVTGIDLLIASDVAEEFADIDEIMSHVYDTHAYLRLHVPPSDVVLTTPVLPLTILQDTLPRQLISHLMNGSNAITAPPKKFDKIVQLYKLLFCRSLALHAANAAHENLFRIAKGALGADVARILTPDLLEIKDSQTDVDAVACATGVSAHYFTYTSWHVAVENVIVNAIYGSPCPFLSRSPAAVAAAADQAADIDAMEHTSRLCQISVVGELKFERSSSTAFKKVSLHKRWLQFDASDRAFILQLAEKTSGNNPMTWCLTAPFPKLVMQHFPNPSCVVNRCKKGLRLWQFQAPKSDLLQAQLKMRSFLTELQCKLPDGNFANVFPAYPCSFVVVNDKTDKDTHSAIHRLHRSSCNTFFTRESEDGIRAMFDGLATAWRSIFSTNKLGHTLDSACEGLASVSVYQLDQNASIMHRNSKAQVDSWLKAVTAYLADYHHEISVQLTKPAEASTDDLIVLE